MKKLQLFIFLLLALSSQSQNIIFSEDFDSTINGSQIPAGWQSIVNAGPRPWEWHAGPSQGATQGEFDPDCELTTSCNGFVYYDSDANPGPDGTICEDADLISPVINCSANSVVYLKFNEWFWLWNDANAACNSQAILYISNDGTNWTDLYHAEAGLQQDEFIPNPTELILDISSYAANQSTVYIKWKWLGDWGYFWMVDDIEIYQPAPFDVGVTEITAPETSCDLTNSELVSVTIENTGINPVDSFFAALHINGSFLIGDFITAIIQPGQSYSLTFTFPADFSSAGQYDMVAWTDLMTDGIHANDTFTETIYNVVPTVIDSPGTFMGFEPADNFEQGWSTEDVNDDGIGWSIDDDDPHSGANVIHSDYNASEEADDWFYSTCLDLVPNQQYLLEFDYKVYDSTVAEKMEIALGDAPNHVVMDNIIYDFGEITNGDWAHAEVLFDAANAGTYYLGWHAYSDADAWWIYVDDINIRAVGAPVAEYTFMEHLQIEGLYYFEDHSLNYPMEWYWDFGDDSSSTIQNPNHQYLESGFYTVCLTASNATGSSVHCEDHVVFIGIDELLESYIFTFPNPASDFLQIKFSQPLNEDAEMFITNMLGEKMMDEEMISVGEQNKKIDVRNLADGIYFLQIKTGEKTYTQKFTIAK